MGEIGAVRSGRGEQKFLCAARRTCAAGHRAAPADDGRRAARLFSIAAHGHADALAVTLSVAGRELIVTGGRQLLRQSAWRAVQRGTRAHPTVCVDGRNQAVMGGPFYWSGHAATALGWVDLDRGIVDAEDVGYRRLDDPVVRRRWPMPRPMTRPWR